VIQNVYLTPEIAYHETLDEILCDGSDDGIGNLEIINYAFCIENPEVIQFNSPVRKFNKEYAQQFFEFIMHGGQDASTLFGLNPNVKNFTDDLASRNTAYGPRIISQLPGLIDEFMINPSSRRAVIVVLNSEDQVLLPEKNQGSKMEYPCTVSLIFLIRKKRLNLHVAMRSNNMTTTINYDLFNFIRIQKELLNQLKVKGLDVELGKYYHVCASAHVLKQDIEFANKITDEYYARKVLQQIGVR